MRILVGAPLGKNLQPQTYKSGALYRCPITQESHDCEQIITDGRKLPGGAYDLSYDESVELRPPIKNSEIKEDQWLGVNVKSQGLGSKVLVCAHRYIVKEGENQYGRGLCYVLTNDLKFDDSYEPCKGKPVHGLHEAYGFCQVGTSAALLENEMILGTPGPYTWRGTVFVTEIAGEYLERNKAFYYAPQYFNSPVDKYSYLGMGVTGGKYFGNNMSYAAGAPRSEGHGQVIIFNKNTGETASSVLPPKQIIDGEQFGSSFGYELITADINGDGEPDLLVAAPFYFNKSTGGAVYVYQNDKLSLPDTPTLKLTGAAESRFGIAMANMGDINKDRCDDIAIGAPYEGNGVVYIFLGNPQGLSKKPSQVIHAADLGPLGRSLRTFGSSLAAGSDLDDNSYPDLVVGAYGSSAVIALFTRPIINIQTKARGNELKNIDPSKSGCSTDRNTNLTCFTFEACCLIASYEEHISNTKSKELTLLYTIEAETYTNVKKFSRVFFDNEKKRSNVVKRQIMVKPNSRQSCYKETAYIKENTKDIQSSIKFRLNFTIVEQELQSSALIGLNPILNKEQSAVEFEGTFQKDCGYDNVCQSQLVMQTEVDLEMTRDEYELVLGESEEFKINVNITNLADSAYEAQLFFVHQKSITYIAASKTNSVICNRYNETIVSCSLGNPLKRDSVVQVSIRFDPNAIDDDIKKLNFQVFANSTSQLIGELPKASIDINVVKKASLGIGGWARPEQAFYGGEVKGESAMVYMEDVGTSITHTYQVYNEGPWKATNVTVHISWPHQVANDKPQGKWLLYLESQPIVESLHQSKCSVVNSNDINPLKLKMSEVNHFDGDTLPPESFMLHPNRSGASYTYTGQRSFVSSKKVTSTSDEKIHSFNSEAHLNRVKRDRAKIIRPEHLYDKDGKKHDVVIMDCEKNTAKCIHIRCDLFNMPQKTEAYIHVKARLWNSTLVSDYPRVDLVKIVSRARIIIPKEAFIEQIGDKTRIQLETKAYPELLDQVRDSSTPWWIIAVSVACGILLLILLAAVMYRCGFFKRRRPDPTLSGNIEKSSEHKPFLGDK
ncbi:integrin alpha-PS1 [Condylostylus longicornis]|uniref:integrin alpha-PS1 n=1 Tax=Condylostylus longicornis TaxID=2530218 RepID=UPI00244DA707|nr:integrin alpha-PS1 [Condylostylus longicornis]